MSSELDRGAHTVILVLGRWEQENQEFLISRLHREFLRQPGLHETLLSLPSRQNKTKQNKKKERHRKCKVNLGSIAMPCLKIKSFKKCAFERRHSAGWQNGSVGKGIDCMSSIPGTHMVGGENKLSQAAF